MAVKVDSIEEAAYIAGQAAENTRLKEENARLRSEAVRLDEMVDDIREVAASQAARIAELEAMWVEERAARLWADDIFRYEGHLTWSEVDARTRSHCIEEARAALQEKAAPEGDYVATDSEKKT
jgi:hypothetical protein